jgi:endoglucanase
MELNTFIKQLITQPGLSGYEGPVRDVIAEAWRPLVDELSVSRVGSLHGLRRGSGAEPRPRVLIATHMDAIGLMATRVIDGLIRFTMIGGVDARILPGQKVLVHGRQALPGMVIQPPAALLPASVGSNPVGMENLFIDVGLRPAEVSELVRPGDPISFDQQPMDLSGDVICGHTLDNRASVAAATVCLEELRRMTPVWDVVAAATVQEETSYAGAYTSTFDVRPDLAVAVDVTFAKGPGATDFRTFPLGKGVALGMGANIHPALFEEFKKLADTLDMPYGVDAMPGHSGTDGYATQVTAEGVPTMVVSIPLRYMHTPVEMVCMKDITRVGHLLAEFIVRLTPDYVSTIRWED